MRILLVEDDAVQAWPLVKILRKDGHDVEWCVFAESAVVKLKVFVPDLLLVDLFLGQESGLDLIKRLRAETAYRSTPTILMSASGADRLSELQALATAHVPTIGVLQKPFGPAELDKAMAEVGVLNPPKEDQNVLVVAEGKAVALLKLAKEQAESLLDTAKTEAKSLHSENEPVLVKIANAKEDPVPVDSARPL